MQIAVFVLFGFGFYLLHGCIQVHVTDLSQTARGAALSLHSSRSFLGQAIGPISTATVRPSASLGIGVRR